MATLAEISSAKLQAQEAGNTTSTIPTGGGDNAILHTGTSVKVQVQH